MHAREEEAHKRAGTPLALYTDRAASSFGQHVIEAGGWALVFIGLLLWVVLRRFIDVLLLPVSGREEPLMHRFIARENYAAPTTTWIGDT